MDDNALEISSQLVQLSTQAIYGPQCQLVIGVGPHSPTADPTASQVEEADQQGFVGTVSVDQLGEVGSEGRQHPKMAPPDQVHRGSRFVNQPLYGTDAGGRKTSRQAQFIGAEHAKQALVIDPFPLSFRSARIGR